MEEFPGKNDVDRGENIGQRESGLSGKVKGKVVMSELMWPLLPEPNLVNCYSPTGWDASPSAGFCQ